MSDLKLVGNLVRIKAVRGKEAIEDAIAQIAMEDDALDPVTGGVVDFYQRCATLADEVSFRVQE